MRLRSWSNMEADCGPFEADYEEGLRFKIGLWITYYCPLTRRWMPRLSHWWDRVVYRLPPRPPLAQDPVAMALGLVPDPHDGSPASVRAAELRARRGGDPS